MNEKEDRIINFDNLKDFFIFLNSFDDFNSHSDSCKKYFNIINSSTSYNYIINLNFKVYFKKLDIEIFKFSNLSISYTGNGDFLPYICFNFNFNNGLRIKGFDNLNSFKVNKMKVRGGLKISYCKVSNIDLSQVDIDTILFNDNINFNLSVSGSSIDNIDFYNESKIFKIAKVENNNKGKVKIGLYYNKINILNIKYIDIEKLDIINNHLNDNYLNSLYLNNILLNKDAYINFSDIEFKNLDILNSNLGKTIFNGVKIKKLYLENTTLNDCIFNGVEFPNNYKLDTERSNDNIKLTNKQLKDNYRQLKFIMDKNGNYSDANSFFSREMDYYFQSISWTKNFSKKIILLIQGLISYFGNCWVLSLLWIILFGLFVTGLQSEEYFYFNNSFSYYNNIIFYNSFFTNINPFDKSLFTEEGITYGKFSHKIILIVLYWHLVVAFKRTTKR